MEETGTEAEREVKIIVGIVIIMIIIIFTAAVVGTHKGKQVAWRQNQLGQVQVQIQRSQPFIWHKRNQRNVW